MTLFEKLALAVGGLIAIGIGTAILAAPTVFHASHGIALEPDPSLMSEIRAPGAALIAVGCVLCAALARASLSGPAMALGAFVFLSYGLARVLSILLDGWPDTGLVQATVLELVMGAAYLTALLRRRWPAAMPA